MKAYGKAYGRYLLGALPYAAGFFILGQILWPNNDSPSLTIGSALTFGLLMQALPFLRDLLGLKENDSFPPIVYVAISLMGLFMGALWWYRNTPPQLSGVKLFALCVLVAFCLYYLVRGIMLLRRGRALNGGVGT